jgi:hypothetical protein
MMHHICGHQASLNKPYTTTTTEDDKELVIQSLNITSTQRPYLYPKEAFEQFPIVLYSSYLGPVTLSLQAIKFDSVSMHSQVQIKDRCVNVVILDAKSNNISENSPLSKISQLAPHTISLSKNLLCYQISLLTQRKVYQLNNISLESIDKEIDFNVDTDKILKNRMLRFLKDEFGETEIDHVTCKIPTRTLSTYKTLQHKLTQYNVAVDVLFNSVQYLHFLEHSFGRVSINKSNELFSVVNLSGIDNAYWNGSYMVYGTGKSMFFALGSADIVAHELTHGLLQDIVGFEYRGHPGMMCEGSCDFVACCFEFYLYEKNSENRLLHGKADWLIGEDVMQDTLYALRNMACPEDSACPQPCSYKGKRWVNPSGSYDFGGVHINSGVFNKLFYLISESVGRAEALKLWYTTMFRMRPKSDLMHLRDILIYLSPFTNILTCLDAVNLGLSEISDQQTTPVRRRLNIDTSEEVPTDDNKSDNVTSNDNTSDDVTSEMQNTTPTH